MKKDLNNFNTETTETTETTGATRATNLTQYYILATLYRYVAGNRTCLGTVNVSLDTSSGRALDNSISSFKSMLGIAIESALVQAISVGDWGDVEVELDLSGLYSSTQAHVTHNPAGDPDIQARGLFGLSEDVTNKLEAKIRIEAEECVWDVHEAIMVFLVLEVLPQI